jgi:predicted RNase H-like HicB family nuclease
MDTYEIELEPAEPNGFTATVPAVPGLLVLGRSVDEVLEGARAAIAFHVGRSGSPGCLRRIDVVPRSAHERYVA